MTYWTVKLPHSSPPRPMTVRSLDIGGGLDHRPGQRECDWHPGGMNHGLDDVGHLPDGYKPAQVAPALAAKIQTLPEALRGSLTWDQGADARVETGPEGHRHGHLLLRHACPSATRHE